MKYITAIIRSICLDTVVKSLKEAGIRGITISEVRGTGDEVVLYTPYSVHNKLEIITRTENVDKVITLILECSQTCESGDGVIVVHNVEELIKIQTGERVSPDDV